MNYDEYVADFNTGDDARLVAKYFAPDITFTGGSRKYTGTQELLEFLRWAHDGVREIIRVQCAIQQGNKLFAEIDMDFHASKDRPDFPFKSLQKGDMTTVKFFVLYTFTDGKISELKSATWPADYQVTKPRAGSAPASLL